MDILTPKGIKTLEQECRAYELLTTAYPTLSCMITPKDQPAAVDAVLCQNGVIHAIAETKCRTRMTLETLKVTFNYSWLVTFDKIVKARQVAIANCVPLVGLLYMVDTDELLVQKICDNNGDFLVPMWMEITETQRTVNGGRIRRYNAFIKMNGSTLIRSDGSVEKLS